MASTSRWNRGSASAYSGQTAPARPRRWRCSRGSHPPDAGSIELFGQRWGQGKDRLLRQRLGVQLQETALGDKLEVVEVLQLFRSFCERGRRIDDVLELVALGPERSARYHTLSVGRSSG